MTSVIQVKPHECIPGIQGGPLEHVIAAKAVAFGEALQPEFKEYQVQVKKNAATMAQAFVDKGYDLVSGGTDNHCMLIDLRGKYPELTGKVADRTAILACAPLCGCTLAHSA